MPHASHCCIIHGCKYGEYDTCTVCNGTVYQKYLCEFCYDDIETNININLPIQRNKVKNIFLKRNRKLKLEKINSNE